MNLINEFVELLSSTTIIVPQNDDGTRKVNLSQFFSDTSSSSPRNTSGNCDEDNDQRLLSVGQYDPRRHQDRHYYTNIESDSQCRLFSAPCLQFKKGLSTPPHQQGRKVLSLFESAVTDLRRPLYATNRSTIDGMPQQILYNISASMHRVLQSRLRASMAALIARTTKLGDLEEADVLHRLYLSERAIDISDVVTTFDVLVDDVTSAADGSITKPILFQTIMNVRMFCKLQTFKVQTLGNISVIMDVHNSLFIQTRISLDTATLLKSMMYQAKIIVKKTMKRAASITSLYSKMKARRRSNNTNDRHYEDDRKRGLGLMMPNSTTTAMLKGPVEKERDLFLYPELLRETVKEFLPDDNCILDSFLERYPPQLANTLLRLATGEGEDEDLDETEQGTYGQSDTE